MRSGISRLRKQSVYVHCKDDTIFKGVLTDSFHDCLVLANPVSVDPSQPPDKQEEPLGGKAVLPRANVAWLQVL